MSTTIDSKVIAYGDIVRHRDGKTYAVSDVSPDSVSIAENYVGTVFTGTVEQARAAGFAFGDEPFQSNARPISHFDLPRIAEIAEGGLVGVLHTEEQRSSLLTFIPSAVNEITRIQMELRGAQTRISNAQQEMAEYRQQVRDAVIEAAKEHDLCRAGTNEFLESVGLDGWNTKYRVTGTLWGKTLLTVSDVECDSEEDAIAHVSNNLRLDVNTVEVTLNAESDDTDGISEDGEATYEDSEVGDAFDADAFMRLASEAIEWSAEEQD